MSYVTINAGLEIFYKDWVRRTRRLYRAYPDESSSMKSSCEFDEPELPLLVHPGNRAYVRS